MKSLLAALERGRLIELPEIEKEKALELLAHLIEAIPDIGTKNRLMKSLMERENQANTAIGRGVACPHCRSPNEGALLCAVGWSPAGIDYGAPDGRKVHLVVMYYVPESERNAYLKEISALAKAISAGDSIESISNLPDLHTVRDKLLDWVGLAISETLPEVKARMIKLEIRQATSSAAATPGSPITLAPNAHFFPFRLVTWQGGAVVLCGDPALAEALERTADLVSRISAAREFDLPDYRIAVLAETIFAANRREYEAVAVRMV
ncbi:MAG: PTS sugar transporter subunit IIA [Spirochaetes bacterium]|nr:PTS sugar transporter subunit IIA [Spirochaetota bacterium]